MDIVEYGLKLNYDCVLCLGYFDGIHLGHTALINKAKEIAKAKNIKLAVFLFTGGKNSDGDLFTFEERLIKLKALGVDTVIYTELNDEFKNTSAEDFLKDLTSFYSLKTVVTGEDFTYGKKAQGNVKSLREFMQNNGVEVLTFDLVLDGNEKVSTRDIKNLLKQGEIVKANNLLGGNYFIRERVVKGKQKGRDLGFPTANMLLSSSKMQIKSGVYLTLSIIDGKIYPAITNVGSQPTFNGENTVIESYFHGFNGDLYDKILSVYFVDYIRDIKRFNSEEELKAQLKKDLELLK